MLIEFRRATVDFPDEPVTTLDEVAQALRTVAERFPALAEMLPAGHPWREPTREHGLVSERIISGVLTELGFASEAKALISFVAQVHDLGRVPDALKKAAPERFRGLDHAQSSVMILEEWGIPNLFANPAAWDVISYGVAHHGEAITRPLEDSSPEAARRYVALCLVRDADKAAAFQVKADRRLNNPEEIAHQVSLLVPLAPHFDPEAKELSELALARFAAHAMSSERDAHSYADYMLAHLSYLFDVNHLSIERMMVLGGAVGLYLDWFRRTIPEAQYPRVTAALYRHLATIWD